MNEPTRRDFMQQAMVAVPILGLMLPEPKAQVVKQAAEVDYYRLEPTWREGNVPGCAFWTFNFGHGETCIFTPGNTPDERWYIRCGLLWRRGDGTCATPSRCGSDYDGIFHGTLEEAKKEAERFTLAVLKQCVVAVDRVVHKSK